MVAAGRGYRPTARILGLSLGTAKRYARAVDVEELLASAARAQQLEEFKPYLHERWNAGHTRPIRLFEEIHALGYGGSYHNVRDYIRRLHRWTQAQRPSPVGPGLLSLSWDAGGGDHLASTFTTDKLGVRLAHGASRAGVPPPEASSCMSGALERS